MTQTLRRLFLRPGGVLIPKDFTCVGAPASCPRAHALLQSLGRPLDAPYIMSLTEGDVVWGPLRPLWGPAPCHLPRRRFEGRLKCALARPAAPSAAEAARPAAAAAAGCDSGSCDSGGTVVIDGVIGYFTSTLYGDIVVDSRPLLFPFGPAAPDAPGAPGEPVSPGSGGGGGVLGSRGRTAMHWEAFYFPLEAPVRAEAGAALEVVVAQVTARAAAADGGEGGGEGGHGGAGESGGEPFEAVVDDELWYEWRVGGSAVCGGRHRGITLGAPLAAVSAGAPPAAALPPRGGNAAPEGSGPPKGAPSLELAMLLQKAERWQSSYVPAGERKGP